MEETLTDVDREEIRRRIQEYLRGDAGAPPSPEARWVRTARRLLSDADYQRARAEDLADVVDDYRAEVARLRGEAKARRRLADENARLREENLELGRALREAEAD